MNRTIFKNKFIRVDFNQPGASFDFYNNQTGKKIISQMVPAVSVEINARPELVSKFHLKPVQKTGGTSGRMPETKSEGGVGAVHDLTWHVTRMPRGKSREALKKMFLDKLG